MLAHNQQLHFAWTILMEMYVVTGWPSLKSDMVNVNYDSLVTS